MLTLGDKIIAGSFKTGASWEVGDVGISAFGIDEALNKRRYLNGQVISQAQFVEFTAMLKSRVSVYPGLETTEVNWQAEVTNSALGQCGKFVIDDDAGTIRLPKVVNINGLQDLTGLGTTIEAGLPNITYSNSGYTSDPTIDGALAQGDRWNVMQNESSSSSRFIANYSFDASRCSSVYGNNITVQQEAVQYPYFIQVAEGVETSIDVSREIELNNPFSLLDYKYSEYELGNASWLLSNGQWNSGAVYQSVYNLLLQIYNGTTIKAGVSVKLSTETYADTDFVLNTTDTTFRLPLKVALASGKAVVGNGNAMALTTSPSTDATSDAATHYFFESENNSSLTGSALQPTSGNPVANGTSRTDYGGFANSQVIGLSPNPTLSGIETSSTGLYLYFYVGEVVQDANIIAAASVLTDVADLKNASNFSQTGLSTLSGLGMPSDNYDELTAGASGATYTAPANGYFCAASSNSWVILAYDKDYSFANECPTISGVSGGRALIPVKKGDIVNLAYGSIERFRFYYAEGEE